MLFNFLTLYMRSMKKAIKPSPNLYQIYSLTLHTYKNNKVKIIKSLQKQFIKEKLEFNKLMFYLHLMKISVREITVRNGAFVI